MTRDRSFKRLVRARMEKTGERYAAARASLLAAAGEPATEPATGTAGSAAVLVTSDAEIRRRTGRGWEEWFDLLDEWGAEQLSHRDIARRVADELQIQPLVWEAQAVTMSYERARRGRVVGQRADGFAVTAAKTIAAPADRLFDAFVDEARRARWLGELELGERTSTRARSARFDTGDGHSRVHVTFDVKGPDKTTVTVEHARLADADAAGEMRTFWRARLRTLADRTASDDGPAGGDPRA